MKYDWKFKYQCVLDYKEGKDIDLEYFPSKRHRKDYVRMSKRFGLKKKNMN